LILAVLDKYPAALFYVFAFVFYITQLTEALLYSATMRTLWQQNKWIEFNVFKVWFFELKKCRPVLNFIYIPSTDEQELLAKYLETE